MGLLVDPTLFVGRPRIRNGGLAPLNLSKSFLQLGAAVGVLLLLFMLGLEYSGEQLKENLSRMAGRRRGFRAKLPPGLAAGILFGWNFMAAVLLGGVTWISSSGLIVKVLTELNRLQAPETASAVDLGARGSGGGGLSAAGRGTSGRRRTDEIGSLGIGGDCNGCSGRRGRYSLWTDTQPPGRARVR